MTADLDLARLTRAAYDATVHVAPGVDAVQLYREASRAAERRIPGLLGIAIAGMLAIAAESRRAHGLVGNLGEHRTMLVLALTVLGQLPDSTT